MREFAELATQVMARCETLGTLSQDPTCLDRRYLTEQHRLANQLASGWMIEAGMTTWQDAVGNIWGRYTSSVPNAPRLILGSHLDTVPNGGKYDGMLGVVAAISLVLAYLTDTFTPVSSSNRFIRGPISFSLLPEYTVMEFEVVFRPGSCYLNS